MPGTSAAIQDPLVYFPNTSQSLTWGPLYTGKSAKTANPIPVTDISGTMTLLDPSQQPVAGATNLSFSQATDENNDPIPGAYQVTIAGASFNPTPGPGYSTLIIMNSPSLNAPIQWIRKSIVDNRGPQ